MIAQLFIKLKAKIEGESFEPFDKSYLGNIAEIIKSILDETEYNDAPKSRIAELLLELKEELEAYTEISVSGAIASFVTNVAKALVNCKANIVATESGSGVKSPSNPYVVNGFSGANIVKTGGQIELARAFNGLLKGTFSFINLGSFAWNYSTEGPRFTTTTGVSDISLASNFTNLIANGYNTISSATAFSQMQNLDLKRSGSTGNINIKDTSFGSDVNAFRNAMNSVYLIYELDAPITPTITPEQFEMLCSAFGVDGAIYTLPFGQTVYGGVVDAVAGNVKIMHGLFEFDGSNDEEWNKYTVNTDQTMWRTSIPERKSGELAQTGNINSICNRFERATNTSTGRIQGKYAGALTYFDVIYNDASDLTAWRTWLANNPIQLAVELATPIEIPLSDLPDIITMIGTNNIFADTGNIELTYLYKGQPETTNVLSSNNFGGLLGMDTENNNQEE